MFTRLKDYDFFATIVGLRYKGSWRYQTTPGALCSIVYIIFMLTMIIYFTQDYFSRNSINLVVEEIKFSEPPQLDISNGFTFAIMIEYGNNQEYNSNIFNLSFEYVEINRSSNKTKIEQLNSRNCTEQFLQYSDFSSNNILTKNILCINTSNIIIQGSDINRLFSFIRVKLNLCKNNTLAICKNESEIYSAIQTLVPKIHFFFLDATINAHKSDQYFSKTIIINSKKIVYDTFKQSNLFFSKNTLFVKESILFETNPTLYSEFTLNDYEDSISLRSLNNSDFLNINLLSANRCLNYHLSYQKIWVIFANLSGILNGVYFIFNFSVYYINNMLFQMDFINDTYRIKNKQIYENKAKITKSIENLTIHRRNKTTDEKLTINKPNSTVNLNIFQKISDNKLDVERDDTKNDLVKNDLVYPINNLERLNEQSEFIEGITKVQNKIKLKTSNDNLMENLNNKFITNLENDTKKIYTSANESENEYIDFNVSDIITISFCVCFGKCNQNLGKKINIYSNINDYLNSWQDFSNIFKKLIEIDLLKYLLLDNDQLTIFKSLLKPQLYIHTDPKYLGNLDSFSKFYNENVSVYLKDEIYFTSVDKKERELLKRSILNILHKGKMTDLDDKLIKRFKKI